MKLTDFSTAQAGILQSAAYRNLQKFMTLNLKEFGVTMPEWGLLSLVQSGGEEGRSMSDIANVMNYKLSHVTNLSNTLEEMGYITRKVDSNDKRHKSLVLTTEGTKFVELTEETLRTRMDNWLKGDIGRVQLVNYIKTLQDIAALDVKI